MFWSKSFFFEQSIRNLVKKRKHVKNLLHYKKIPLKPFLAAYDYFIDFPLDFERSIMINGLNDIPSLDLSAMVHNYQYAKKLPSYKGLKWLQKKIKTDWQYGKNRRRLGKGIITPYLRSILLIISTPIYWIIVKIKNLKTTEKILE